MALFGKFSGASNTVGIDIGSHSIKVAQVAASRNGYTLMRAGSTLTPPESVKQGAIEDRFAVAEAIRTLLQDLGISNTLAVAAISGPTVMVRQVQLPAMPEHQLRKSIYWEARNYISLPVEDSLIEFQILDTHTTDGIPQMDVMLVAAPRDIVDTRVAALEQAGVDPIAVELEPFALIRGLVDLPSGNTGSVALVDIGATYTHISIISNGNFALTRSVTTAGNSFTEAISRTLSIDFDQAERVKEEETQVVTDELIRAGLSPLGQEASRAIESTLEELIKEIRRSFAFHDYQQIPGSADRSANSGISRVILSGGSAKLAGLDRFLQDQLSIPVELADLFGHGMIHLPEGSEELQSQMPLLATAFGLALREPMLAHEKGGMR
jgi:type IV pilus assembly protein PilM